jgi:hypothetical protein
MTMPRPLLLAAALAALAACGPQPRPHAMADPSSAHPAAHAWAAAAGDSADGTQGVHGMLLFGETELYLSHLPLYRAPHDWQMILAARLVPDERTGRDIHAAYVKDVAESKQTLYTVEPERFPHGALALAATGTPVRFRATVYRGHFERGGTPILRDVVMEVTRVIERRRVAAGDADAAEGSFLLFGDPTSEFLAHRVAGAPDFDQVMRIGIPDGAFTPAELARGIAVSVPGHPAGEPLREGAEVTLRTESGKTVRAVISHQYYLEHGDLAGP